MSPFEPLPSAGPSEGTDPGGANRPAAGPGLPVRDAATVISGGSSSRRVQGKVAGPIPLPLLGQRIDCFELVESIGVGGMGAVYRALDSRLQRTVALKLLPPGQAVDPEVVQRFYQEGRAAARLDHENIARVYTIGHDADYHFIAFEYIEGTTIRQRVERGGVPPVGEAINYILQIANALVHANERGVVHRDVKPSNIIITPFGRAKLVDMGLARRFERDGDDGLTQSGMTLGTFDYISPEQARDPRSVDVRSDLYSLGCTLFYILTGRPPFPDGTVLQKLLHHQEDTPPDVRSLNSKVPAHLASIVEKLMAKDRDRRYQTPEQLVRDLLLVAGALGLRSLNPEGLVWMTVTPPPAWERHLVWGIPALAFSVVVATLTWWGQEEPTPTTSPDAPSKWTASSPKSITGRERRPDVPEDTLGAYELPESGPADVARSSSRDISVTADEDLLSVLTSAPPDSVVTLTEEGPYTVGARRTDRRSPARLLPQGLTIKAGRGIRPILRAARAPDGPGNTDRAVLDVKGGRLTLEGLEFVVESEDRDADALRTEDTQLAIRRCLFRRIGPSAGRGRSAALHVGSSIRKPAGQGWRASVVADACHFGAGEVGVHAEGPVDVLLRDCTLAADGPAFRFDNGGGAGLDVADLSLHHVSILAGEGPVFRFEGTAPRVAVEDSAIAPPHDSSVTLVATDDPDGLDWRGRGNLYSRVGTFLQPTGRSSDRSAIREPSLWIEDASAIRESVSTTTQASIWEAMDPEQALAREPSNPGQALRLAAIPRGTRPPGARRGPLGTLAAGVALAANTPAARRERAPLPETPRSLDGGQDPRESSSALPMPMPMPIPAEGGDGESPRIDAPPDVSDLLPMGVDPSPRRSDDAPEQATEPEASAPPRAAAATDPDASASPAASNPLKPGAGEGNPPRLDTAEAFQKALGRAPVRGQELVVASDADWTVSSSQIRAEGPWSIRAEPGKTRPKLRFRPSPADPKVPTTPSVWLELRSGALELEGIDILLPRSDAPREGRWAAFWVWAGAELSLKDCTLTIEGEGMNSAAVVLRTSDNQADGRDAGRTPIAATVRLKDSLLRSGDDLIDVAPGPHLNLELNNVVLSTGGSFVHAHGSPRGQGQGGDAFKLNLEHVSARVAGGLVLLESAPDEPELPAVEIIARNSNFATTAEGAPLLRVDGQDALISLHDRIRWKGQAVGYHQIDTYRRDQSAQPGAIPASYDLQSWQVAIGPLEESPIHGDLKFVKEWDATRPAWSLEGEDLRLSPESSASLSGAELRSIPPAPPSDSP